jgi:hypothetical protein
VRRKFGPRIGALHFGIGVRARRFTGTVTAPLAGAQSNELLLARSDDDADPLPLHGNESFRQHCEVMFLAASLAEPLQEEPVRDESETSAAVITALHVSTPDALLLLSWTSVAYPYLFTMRRHSQ